MKSLVVFCGAKSGSNGVYLQAAGELGTVLAQQGIRLIYGGGNKGVMGVLASSVLKGGGQVIGITPKKLFFEHTDFQLTETHVVEHIHTRKQMMYEMADGAIVLPGGFGMMEEAMEFIAWTQLGFHNKPCVLLNVHGYFNWLIEHFDHMVSEGFLSREHRRVVQVTETPMLAVRSIYEI
jgi:uncharacterized protein (TIGR00730 family)